VTGTGAGRVGLVLVSHSAALAAGLAELAGQMAPDVPIRPAGGLPDGGLGTDFAAITEALTAADTGRGAVLLYDLGSAQMTAELAVEALADPESALLVDAPLVEGAVAAAVAAQNGADLTGVAAAARSAGSAGGAGDASADAGPEAAAEGERQSADLELTNDIGLHARPAAMVARSLAGLDATVTVALGEHTADARSVLALLGLTARQGDRITVTATGPQSADALAAISRLVETDFAG
jgi:phosphoenolpyruvate---glycerone phosphotransferase subunit DhaM